MKMITAIIKPFKLDDVRDALAEAGVDVVMCGQTAMSRGFYPDLPVPEAKVALSAMTALVRADCS